MHKNLITLLIFLLFLLKGLILKASGDEFTSSSVLSSGTWLKIAVVTEGIYRIDYSVLKQKGLPDPSNPRIFTSNEGQLSYYNDGTAPDDLKEAAIFLNTGADGVFNEGDYLLFYGMGTHRWKYNETTGNYSFLRHNYSDTAFYFITSGGQSKRITAYQQPLQEESYTSEQTDAFFYHENENENLIKSGRDWFEKASPVSGLLIDPGFTDAILNENVLFISRVAARSSSESTFSIFEGNTIKKNIKVPPVNLYNTTGTFAAIVDSVMSIEISSTSPSFEIRFNTNGKAGATGWLDYIRIQARIRNVFNGQFKTFLDSRSVGNGRITKFLIGVKAGNPLVWDVTDQYNVMNIPFTFEGSNISFKYESDHLRKFVAFSADNALVPIIKNIIPNQDLHASPPSEMIIITHPLFRSYAEELADIHMANSGLKCMVTTTSHIYNEFSGGVPDIAALRNFVRMKYSRQKGTDTPMKYLLLFGDGSFENKTLPPANPNFIPTYQSKNSNVVVSSFTSDDFYGLLEEGEGESEGTEDIGIGRIPARDTSQAAIVLRKIRRYLDPVNMGDWRNIITLTADDEDGNSHVSDAEGLDAVLKQEAPEYNVEKLYLDAFRQVTLANGQTYPEVRQRINDRLNKGCLIFNYTGHGNESFLAHEKVLSYEDYMSWRNSGRLPLFITATCEFSRFDDIDINFRGEISEKSSAGEMILFSDEGGAIALMSTTRVVFSAPNFFLNRNIFNCAFDVDSTGNPMRLGDIIRIAKNNSGNGSNKRNFSLLGDPALRLAYPWHGRVSTDSINNRAISSGTDSLKALSIITITGHIDDQTGNIAQDFNGIVTPIVFDKETRIRTLANDGGPSMEFGSRNNIIFSGQTRAKNGRFTFTFIVPRDINYSFGQGKISYYANDSARDMNGSFSEVIVGGFKDTGTADNTGPLIRLFMNDTLFRNGGITNEEPLLLALLEDENGINTTGVGIGHDVTGFIDNDRENPVVLNNSYINDFNSYQKGKIEYRLTALEKGTHTFTLKAWDNFNNSSEETITFFVENSANFILRNVVNFPNPFSSSTNITGEINKADETLKIRISIFNINGALVKTIDRTIIPSGYVLPPVEWDGCDDNGRRMAYGIYPYVVTIKSEKEGTARATGKMIIL
jgi:hypothetical protein